MRHVRAACTIGQPPKGSQDSEVFVPWNNGKHATKRHQAGKVMTNLSYAAAVPSRTPPSTPRTSGVICSGRMGPSPSPYMSPFCKMCATAGGQRREGRLVVAKCEPDLNHTPSCYRTPPLALRLHAVSMLDKPGNLTKAVHEPSNLPA